MFETKHPIGISADQEPMLPVPFRVADRWDETDSSFTFVLEPQSKKPFSFSPGQFNMLYAWGIGEVPISMSGDPSNSDRLVHTIRKVGAVTGALAKLRVNDLVGVRGPFGNHWPLETAHGKDVVVAAGGLGLAPLRPLIYRLMRESDSFGDITLLYGAKRSSDLLFVDEIESWRKSGKLRAFVTVDTAGVEWKGNVGHVTTLLSQARYQETNSTIFLCGPEVMMRFMAVEFVKRGTPTSSIFLSMERNMKCAVRMCGRCQYREHFICADGPVFSYEVMESLLRQREL